MMRTNGWRHLVLIAALLAGMGAQAGFMSRLNPFRQWSPKNRVDTLLVTGNYAESRLLAELAQYRNRQPILLISPEAGGQAQVFFMPSAPEATAVPAAGYGEFVDFLLPKQVVFLGDTAFVPQSFIDQVRGRYPTVLFNSRDWRQNAAALGRLLKQRRLARDYDQYLSKLEAASGGRAVAPGTVASPAAPPEPYAAPQLLPPVDRRGW